MTDPTPVTPDMTPELEAEFVQMHADIAHNEAILLEEGIDIKVDPTQIKAKE